MFYYFGDLIKFEAFDFDNILVDEKLYENILINNILYRTLIGLLGLIKQMDLLEFIMELNIQY